MEGGDVFNLTFDGADVLGSNDVLGGHRAFYVSRSWIIYYRPDSESFVLCRQIPGFKIEYVCNSDVIADDVYFSGYFEGAPYFSGIDSGLWGQLSGPWHIGGTTPRQPVFWSAVSDEGETLKYGDRFFTSSSLPKIGETVEFSPEGAWQYDVEPAKVSVAGTFWTSATLLGIYEPQGNASGKMVVGLPYWKDEHGVSYVRSVECDAKGRFNYGDLRYSETLKKWILGQYGSESGWWETDEKLNENSGSVLEFRKLENSEAEGGDLHLSFAGFTSGNRFSEILLGEAARWI